MKKICTVIFMFIPLFLYGQVEHVEEKNQVSSIKKDAAYIYGEGTGDSVEEAQTMAQDLLLAEIKRVIQEDLPATEANLSTLEILANACAIRLKRGTMDRVFLYIKKDNINKNSSPCQAEPIPTKSVQPEPEVQPVVEEPAVTTVQPSMTMIFEPAMTMAEEPVKVEKQPLKVKEEPVKVKEEPAMVVGSGMTMEFEPALIAEEPLKVVEPAPVPVPEVQTKTTAVKAVAQDGTWLSRLLAAPDMGSLISLLKAAKEEHKVMWGEVKSRMEPTWYVVPYTGNKIEAFLDGSRTDLLTGKQDSLNNYSNKNKIWFIIYE